MFSDHRLRALLLATALPAAVLTAPAIASAATAPLVGIAPPAIAALAATSVPDAAGAPPTQVLVRFRSGSDAGDRRSARQAADANFVEPLPLPGLQLVDPEPGVAVRETIARLERSADVLYAEPDAVRTATATVPNDELFDLEWGLNNTGQSILGTAGTPDADIDAPEAWDIETGSAGVSVGVLDSGVDAGHPDLAPNIRVNPGEVPGNGIDDDGNGLADDVSGWDWVDDDNTPDDGAGHGTHVAGTIAAQGNDSTGVTGVAWDAGIVPLRVLGNDGSGWVSDVIKGYKYAADNGIPIVNASLGGSSSSQTERDALAAASNVLFVVAAGNDGADNDVTGSFPCNYDLDNVVCVAATGQSDGLAGFSNYGATTVDLAAPGVNIASTYIDSNDDSQPDWRYLSGTSMATPHVAGVAALVRSQRPSATVAEVRAAMLDSVDVMSSLNGCVASDGRLNAYRALSGAVQTPAPPPAAQSCAARPVAAAPAPAPTSEPEPEPVPEPEPEPTPTPAPSTSPAPAPTTAPADPTEVTASHRPRSVSVRSGRIVRGRGGVARLFNNDGRRLELAARRPRLTFAAELTASARLSSEQRTGLGRLGLVYDGGASRRGVTVRVRVFDWRKRRWQTVATLRNGTRDRTVRWAATRGASRYVSPRGVVRVSIRGTAAKGFRTRSDLLRLTSR
jgi:subtilisin family serine protease